MQAASTPIQGRMGEEVTEAACRQLVANFSLNGGGDGPSHEPKLGDCLEDVEFATLSLKEGTFLDGIISYFESPSKFYLQPVIRTDGVRLQAINLNCYYREDLRKDGSQPHSPDLPPAPPTPLFPAKVALGSGPYSDPASSPRVYCASPYVDGYFYRAQIYHRPAPNKLSVYFVDYGNTWEVDIQELRELPAYFRRMPPVAIPCVLLESLPEWMSFAWLRDKMEGATIVAEIVAIEGETGAYVVKIHKVNPETGEESDAVQDLLEEATQDGAARREEVQKEEEGDPDSARRKPHPLAVHPLLLPPLGRPPEAGKRAQNGSSLLSDRNLE